MAAESGSVGWRRPGAGALPIAVTMTVAFVVLVLALNLAGAAPREPVPGIPDPGILVGWLVPTATLASNFAAIATVGFLLLGALLLPSSGPDVQGLAVDAVRIANRGAWAWVVITAVTLVVTVADVFAVTLTGVQFDLLVALVRDSEIGRGLALQALGALVLAIALRWTIGVRALLGWTVFAVAVLLPTALAGHSASGGSHSLASVSLFLHVAAITVWVGGLISLGWLAARGSKRFEASLRRYSSLATGCFLVVGISGVVSALVRSTDLAQLTSSPYGRLILLKLGAYLTLGGFGWWQRRRIARRSGGFRRLAIAEIALMVATVGVAVALSRTPPPAGAVLLTPVEDLLGGPMPPAPTLGKLLFGLYPSGFGLAVVGFGTVAYLGGLWSIRRHDGQWSAWRTASWAAGMMVLAWVTIGGLGSYTHVMFSAHIASQALLVMIVAPLLVLGAPGALTLRALPGSRQPGEISPQQVLRAVARSRLVTWTTHPLVASGALTASLALLYLTPLFSTLMSSLLGHLGMEFWFLSLGLTLHVSLIGSCLTRARSPVMRFTTATLMLLLAAVCILTLAVSHHPVGGTYWLAVGRPYATDLIADQFRGAMILGTVAAPVLIVLCALMAWRLRLKRMLVR